MTYFYVRLVVALLAATLVAGCAPDEDPYGSQASHPTRQQLLNRQVLELTNRLAQLEACILHMRKSYKGDERSCPK